MRKWMRDRMKRRNKGKDDLQPKDAGPGQAPLQPTFLDREAPAGESHEAPIDTAGETVNLPVEARDIQHELQPEYEPQPETEPQETAAPTGHEERRRSRSKA